MVATMIDLVFLAIAWEYFGKPGLGFHLWLRALLSLLGVMWLDVFLFATGAFAGTEAYLSIMKGTLISRLIVSVFALPFLYGNLVWQTKRKGMPIENRPILAILKQFAEMEERLTLAEREIEGLQRALSKVKTLRGFLPICSSCKKIRDDRGYWTQIEAYIRDHSEAEFTHGICPDCMKKLYPDFEK